MSNAAEIKELLSKEMGITVTGPMASLNDLKVLLTEKFNELIKTDFNSLVQLLYRIDISEAKLKQALKENEGKNTGEILAEMTIERQLQKIKSRQQYKRDENISDDEKW
jgi:hypothetical protein